MSLANATSKRSRSASRSHHRVWRRAVHPDLAVPIGGHEAKCRIDDGTDYRRLDSVLLDHRRPVVHRRAAQRIDSDLHACAVNRFHVDDVAQVADVSRDVIVFVKRRRGQRPLIRNTIHAGEPGLEKIVGSVLNPVGDGGVGRAAIGRIVFEAAVSRRIVRRRDHDAVGKPALASSIVSQDRVRDSRCWRVAAVAVDHRLDAVGGQNFERTGKRRHRERVRVHPEVQRTVDILTFPIKANRLADREDVRLVERGVERGPAMARGAERDSLRRVVRIRLEAVVGGDQTRHVDELRLIDGFSGEWADFHRINWASISSCESRAGLRDARRCTCDARRGRLRSS